jgi:hypothetical protein
LLFRKTKIPHREPHLILYLSNSFYHRRWLFLLNEAFIKIFYVWSLQSWTRVRFFELVLQIRPIRTKYLFETVFCLVIVCHLKNATIESLSDLIIIMLLRTNLYFYSKKQPIRTLFQINTLFWLDEFGVQVRKIVLEFMIVRTRHRKS